MDTTRNKIDKTQQKLQSARDSGDTETASVLERSLEKLQQRLAESEASLAEHSTGEP